MLSWLRIIENSLARLFAAAVQVIVVLLIARQLGPAGQGSLVTATTWIALFASLAGLSLGQVSHQRISSTKRSEWLPSLAGTMLVIGLLSSTAAYALLFSVSYVGDGVFRGIPLPVVAMASLPLCLIVLEEYGRNLLAAAGLLRSYAIAQVAGNLVRLGLVLAAIGPLQLGALGVLGGLAVGQAVIVALEAYAIFNAAGKRLRPSAAQAKGLLNGSLRLHATTVAAFLLGQGNVLLLHRFSSPRDAGWYQLALQGVMAMLLLPQAASMVLYTKVAALGPDGAWPYQKRLMLHVLMVQCAIAVVAACVAPTVLTKLVGPDFAPVASIFRWLMFVVFATSLAELMAPQWYARGAFVLSSVLTCLCAAANLAINAALIPKHGVMGAVSGTVVCYLVFVVVSQLAFAAWCETRHKIWNSTTQLSRP